MNLKFKFNFLLLEILTFLDSKHISNVHGANNEEAKKKWSVKRVKSIESFYLIPRLMRRVRARQKVPFVSPSSTPPDV